MGWCGGTSHAKGLRGWDPKPQVNIVIHNTRESLLTWVPKPQEVEIGTQGIGRVLLYIWSLRIIWHLFTNAWSTNEKARPQIGMASSAVSHPGLALSQQLSHQVGTCDILVSHHMICHLTHHMTSPMICHMTCTWHITWLITWPLDLEKES
jgi:hypothetical protein